MVSQGLIVAADDFGIANRRDTNNSRRQPRKVGHQQYFRDKEFPVVFFSHASMTRSDRKKAKQGKGDRNPAYTNRFFHGDITSCKHDHLLSESSTTFSIDMGRNFQFCPFPVCFEGQP